jgi:hypothetical protein
LRVTAESVNRGLYAGGSAAEFRSFLDTHSRTPVSQSLTYLLDDQQRRFGALKTLSARSIVTSLDEAETVRILAHPNLATLGLRRVSDTVLACDAEAATVAETLRRAGFAPSAEAGSITDQSAGKLGTRPPAGRLWEPATTASDHVRLLAAALLGDPHMTREEPGEVHRQELIGTIGERLRAAAETHTRVSLDFADSGGQMRRTAATIVHCADGYATVFSHDDDIVLNVSVSRISSVES